MADPDNKWSQPDNPPPPLFTGKKERDLVKQVNDELIERVIGQQVTYYPISVEHTDFHTLCTARQLKKHSCLRFVCMLLLSGKVVTQPHLISALTAAQALLYTFISAA
jgi:hypothetical protein